MTGFGILNLVVLPVGFGLLAFVEPCSIGSTLLFIKYIEGKDAGAKLAQTGMFAATRALFLGMLGMLAVGLGAAIIGFQKAAWILLGAVYTMIGLAYLSGRVRELMIPLGPRIRRIAGLRGSASLGFLFGLNIPACAGPLIFALLGAAAANGIAGGTLAAGFISLGLFGLALSLPLVLAVLFEPVRRQLDRLAGLSARLPLWTGGLLVALGLWSIGFALFAHVKP